MRLSVYGQFVRIVKRKLVCKCLPFLLLNCVCGKHLGAVFCLSLDWTCGVHSFLKELSKILRYVEKCGMG